MQKVLLRKIVFSIGKFRRMWKGWTPVGLKLKRSTEIDNGGTEREGE